MTAKARPKVTSQMVMAALRKRFEVPAYALFEEVGNGTGSRQDRWADAVCMSLWPSRGLLLHGIEIKVSRSDWLSELKNPAKSEAVQRYCDHWWLAVGDDTIVQPGELPATWGLLVLRSGKLVCTTEAPKLEPQALDRNFIAALLRRAQEAQGRVRSAGYQEGLEKGANARPEDQQRELDARDRTIEALRASIDDFEQRSGIKLDRWNAGRVGEVVQRMMDMTGGYRRAPRELVENLARQAEEFARLVRMSADTEEREAEVAAQAPSIANLLEAAGSESQASKRRVFRAPLHYGGTLPVLPSDAVLPYGFVPVPRLRLVTKHRFTLEPPRCGCPGCDKPADRERFDVSGWLRCGWCISNCRIRTGEHTPQPSSYEPCLPG